MIRLLILSALLCAASASPVTASSQEPERAVGLNEFQLRRAALRAPVPRCNLAYGRLRELGFSKLAMLVR